MDESPLQKMPGELRNRVAELVLYEPDGVDITIADGHATCRNPPSLPSVCRQLRTETAKMYFAINEFTIFTECLDIELRHSLLAAEPREKYLGAVVACLEAIGHDNEPYFNLVWSAVAECRQGLIGRKGPVLPIRSFHVAFASMRNGKMGSTQAFIFHYHFAYGSDREEMIRCLDATLEAARDSFDPVGDFLMHHAMGIGNDEIRRVVLKNF
ncbi:hypothetical protein LTR56_006096 [Elasticomyces elasticus]|nr:hypothetical protein LTR56_006096 [Elasticomyces elasticus]KAK3667642.1 hypothetical protein LTR22_001457 [Elasticomyces elasticus]KAK4928402.1 hypothetical protein LTR49_004809 [Elasticomyces elasticus]KAK5767203.1 hypothetical protein LTS12_002661 [Elasticomyces elasticus]